MQKLSVLLILLGGIFVVICLELFYFSVKSISLLTICYLIWSIIMTVAIMSVKSRKGDSNWGNLAPTLVRQRIIIELITSHLVSEEEIRHYQTELSQVVDMNVLQPPFSYPAHKDGHLIGFGGWIHWATSGSHVYSYDTPFTGNGKYLFTVDCYTCKPFSVKKAVEFTRNYFKPEKIVWKEV